MSSISAELVSLVQQIRERVSHLESIEVAQYWSRDSVTKLLTPKGTSAPGSDGLPFALNDPVLLLRFNGPQPYRRNFTGSPHSYDGRMLAALYDIYREGHSGKAIQLARASRNRCYNPRFETGIASVTDIGGAGSPSWSTTEPYLGAGCLELPADTTVAIDYDPVVLDTEICISFSYRFNAAGGAPIYVGDLTGSTYATINPVDDQWHRAYVGSASKALSAFHILTDASSPPVYVDAVQVELGLVPTPYLDGGLGPGHSWEGAAHASCSNRDQANLAYDYIPFYARSFTIGTWVYNARQHPGGGTDDQVILSQFDTAAIDQFLHCVIRGNEPRLGFYGDDLPAGVTLEAFRWYHLVFQYDYPANKQRIYIDGQLVAERQPTSHYLGTSGTTYIGTPDGVTGFEASLDGRLDDFFITYDALTPAQIDAIYRSGVGLLSPREYIPAMAARVSKSGSPLISNDTVTTMSWDVVRYNSYNIYRSDTPTRLYAPLSGMYYIYGAVEWQHNANGEREGSILKNGVTALAKDMHPDGASYFLWPQSNPATFAWLAQGEYVELPVYQDSGSSLYISKTNERTPEFGMVWLGG